MKSLLYAICIFILIIICCLLFFYFLEYSVTDINKILENINHNMSLKNHEIATKEFKKLKSLWVQKEKILELQVEHNELDEINELLAELEAFFNHKDIFIKKDEYDEYFKVSYKLNFLLKHIIEKNRLNFETIL